MNESPTQLLWSVKYHPASSCLVSPKDSPLACSNLELPTSKQANDRPEEPEEEPSRSLCGQSAPQGQNPSGAEKSQGLDRGLDLAGNSGVWNLGATFQRPSPGSSPQKALMAVCCVRPTLQARPQQTFQYNLEVPGPEGVPRGEDRLRWSAWSCS